MRNVFFGGVVVLICAGCSGEDAAPAMNAAAAAGTGGAAMPAQGPAGTTGAAGMAMPAPAGASGASGQPAMASDAGGGGSSAGSDAPDPMAPDAMAPIEPEPAWEPLIEGEWEVPPGEEIYLCVRRTLTEDVYVSAFKAQNPQGTHHTVLTVGNPGAADGITPCNSGVNAPSGVFGSGVGTDVLEMPEGVALPLRAGQQLVLNLHLFNVASDQPLTGTSGTLVRTIPEGEVEQRAEATLVTALLLSIPPNQESKQYGQCTMTHDLTVFAVLPHMHTLGTHFKATVERDGETITLHDQAFEFEQQLVYPIEPVQLREGEVVQTECTYMNDTDNLVTFGESSLDEMCNFGLFRYPAADSTSFACSF